MDVGPFREHRDFRLLLIAGTIFYLGGMMTYVAIPFQIYTITGSNLAVGAVGLVELVPLIVFGLYGGALADHVDRRLLLIWTGIAQAAFTAWLAINAFSSHPRLWEIFLVSGLLASASALQRPSREALLPRTVRHDEMVAANALSSFGMQGGVLVGPAIGGVLVASFGPGWCFLVDIVGLFVASMLYAAMRRYPHVGRDRAAQPERHPQGPQLRVSRKDLLGTYLVDLIAMLLAMPVVLFPALAQKVFGDPHLLGLLYSAETVGALVATATSGWTSRIHRHGRAIVIAAMAYGAFVALAGTAAQHLGRPALLRARRWRRHDLGRLPRHDLEPDHPRQHARPARRHRDAELLHRTARRPGPGRLRGGPVERPRRDRQRRRELCRRGRDHRHVAARLLVLRRAHRRARTGGASSQAARSRADRTSALGGIVGGA